MDKILSSNTIKNVFAALGAKTSDNNYGVALLDKTTAEPKGLMEMSDLASVLGWQIKEIGSTGLSYNNDFNNCTASTNCVSFYIVPSGAANKPDPNWVDGFVITLGWINDNYFTQFALGEKGVFYRNYNKSVGFGSWIKL